MQTSKAATRLAEKLTSRTGQPYKPISFEKEYLWGKDVADKAQFLGDTINIQNRKWTDAWNRFKASLQALGDTNCILTMHGCYIHNLYGVRCVYDPGLVATDYKPDIVFTLLTDIYDSWTRTHLAAKQFAAAMKGDPTLEQLLSARRVELLIGDQVALSCEQTKNGMRANAMWGSRVRNLVLSAYQPVQTFVNAVTAGSNLRVAYLSFPISQPRDLENKGDRSARNAVSQFVLDAYQLQHDNDQLIVQCPLAIDEVPFNFALAAQLKKGEAQKILLQNEDAGHDEKFELQFDRAKRWDLKEISGKNLLLTDPPDKLEQFSKKQFLNARAMIHSDVTSRDFRLVDQSDLVAVFNPILDPKRKKMARSVLVEIERAIELPVPVLLFQDKKYDPKDRVAKALNMAKGSKGTMENPPRHPFKIKCETYQELVTHLSKGEVQ